MDVEFISFERASSRSRSLSPICNSLVGMTAFLANVFFSISFHVHHEILVVVDELFGKLPESDVLRLELPLNELAQCTAHIIVSGICSFGTVDADTRLQVLADLRQNCRQQED